MMIINYLTFELIKHVLSVFLVSYRKAKDLENEKKKGRLGKSSNS